MLFFLNQCILISFTCDVNVMCTSLVRCRKLTVVLISLQTECLLTVQKPLVCCPEC